MDRLRKLLIPGIAFLGVLLLGSIFFLHNAHYRLASDDIGWLHGLTPTVFDRYRLIPRWLFTLLYRSIGPNVSAILAMILFFHALNAFLLYWLARNLLPGSFAPLAAAAIFMINPVTLSTLTWISCFSYVLGTTFALVSLLCFIKGRDALRAIWWTAAVLFYAAGLFCSHEILFLPALFFFFSLLWDRPSRKASLFLSLAGLLLGLVVALFFYRFDRYGVTASGLFSAGFIAAFLSSALSFGLVLGLAYPLSFVAAYIPLLQFAFSEPVRWILTVILLSAAVLLIKSHKRSRITLALAFSFAALIAPYIIRLYLSPPGVNYDISYVLTGRVFYLPFTVLALVGAYLVRWLSRTPAFQNHFSRLLSALLAISAYCYALFVLYRPGDFMGLSVLQETGSGFPPPWNPYAGCHPAWIACLALPLLIAVFGRARSHANLTLGRENG